MNIQTTRGMPRLPVVYLAGKIAKDDWRSQIFGYRFAPASDGWDNIFDESLVIDQGAFLYGGPFFISCDHGCAHGPATHGAGSSFCNESPDGRLETRARVLEVNFKRIARCDLFLAYLNSTDCYGTLVEIGYAHALDKNITIGIGRDLKLEDYRDLWIARGCAPLCSPGEPEEILGTPDEIFAKFYAKHIEHWSRWSGLAAVI